ncbi:MAG: hypothetical protein JWM86_2838 [Thermoleophilia bacterium]|nr:hypothetical protein [Thermoleophilia bacterium]
MADAGAGGATSGPQVGGPAAIASALRVLDRHARTLVKLAVAQHAITDGDTAAGVGAWHDRTSRLLHAISLEHGTDAMATAAEYGAAALEAGSIYPGDELDAFLREVAASVRATSRDLTKASPFSS